MMSTLSEKTRTVLPGLRSPYVTFGPLVTAVFTALACGILFGVLGMSVVAVMGACAILMVAGIALVRHDYALLAMGVVMLGVFIDWYPLIDWHVLLGGYTRIPVFATLAAALLIGYMYLVRSPARPWTRIRCLWVWAFLLIYASFAALRSETWQEGIAYYVETLINALLLCIVGAQVAYSLSSVRRLFAMLSALGTIIALHTIIIARTGVFLFVTPNVSSYLAARSAFEISGGGGNRVGSFLLNPDDNSIFLCIVLLLTLGLFFASSSRAMKLAYLLAMAIQAPALLFTYSGATAVGLIGGLIAFWPLSRRFRQRLQFLALALGVAIGVIMVFADQIALLMRHVTSPGELPLREGGWLTALRVIAANPLTGIGLGTQTNYLDRSQAYRVPLQTIPLNHPHNAFLELAAMAGLPVLMAFLIILGRTLWQAWLNYRRLDTQESALLAGALAAMIAVSLNSLATNGWTLPPLVIITWLILGAISSPALARALNEGRLRMPATAGAHHQIEPSDLSEPSLASALEMPASEQVARPSDE